MSGKNIAWKKNILVALAMLLALPFFVVGLVLLGFVGINVAKGQLPPAATGVFGGQITAILQCTCNFPPTILICLGDPRFFPRSCKIPLPPYTPRPALIHFIRPEKRDVPPPVPALPVSILYPYYQIKRIGALLLGIYGPPTVCRYPCGAGCCVAFPEGNILIVGTSL